MGKDTRPYAMNTNMPYQYWLAGQVETVKLPFKLNSPTLLEEEEETLSGKESEGEEESKNKTVEKGD